MKWGQHTSLRTLVTLLLMLSVDGHPNGADRLACVDMIPQHDSGIRTDRPPYYILVSNTTYTPGVPITVTLAANRGDSFKGFLIQARLSEFGTNFDKAVGRFTPVEGSQTICLWDTGLTHTNSDPKTSLTFTWMPPDTLQGQIQFRTTYVQSRYSYWVPQLSDVLNEGQTTTTTTTSTTTTQAPSTSVTSQTTMEDTTFSGTSTDQSTPNVNQNDTPHTTMNSSSVPPIVGDGKGADVASSVLCILVGLGIYLVSRQ